jgi:hypothetical protein
MNTKTGNASGNTLLEWVHLQEEEKVKEACSSFVDRLGMKFDKRMKKWTSIEPPETLKTLMIQLNENRSLELGDPPKKPKTDLIDLLNGFIKRRGYLRQGLNRNFVEMAPRLLKSILRNGIQNFDQSKLVTP